MTEILNEEEVRELCRKQRNDLDALHTRIRQFEGECERTHLMLNCHRKGDALRLIDSAWRSGTINIGEMPVEAMAGIAVAQVIALEEALAAQAEREKANG